MQRRRLGRETCKPVWQPYTLDKQGHFLLGSLDEQYIFGMFHPFTFIPLGSVSWQTLWPHLDAAINWLCAMI